MGVGANSPRLLVFCHVRAASRVAGGRQSLQTVASGFPLTADIPGFFLPPRVTIEHARSRRGRGGGPGMGRFGGGGGGGYRPSRSSGPR